MVWHGSSIIIRFNENMEKINFQDELSQLLRKIDERDEGNNQHYLVVTAVNKEYVAVVPSFTPSIIAVIIVGFLVTYLTRRDAE